MKKINIGVFFGGKSSEYLISLMSSYHVLDNLDLNKYNVIKIGITNDNRWYLYTGCNKKILDDTWHLDNANLSEIQIDLSAKMITSQNNILLIDAALVIMHGKYGEDGSIQGLLNLLDIVNLGCNQLSSAIGINKKTAHQLVSSYGFNVTKSIVLTNKQTTVEMCEKINKLEYPLFIKPISGGSSIGISKIYNQSELENALKIAFSYDNKIIVEENIDGFEVGCAIIGNNNIITGMIDEISLDDFILDFEHKYFKNEVKIYVPARVSDELTNKIKKVAYQIYEGLECSGFARIDMFVTKDNQIYFNEINTIPGLTNTSRFPNMLKAVGISYSEMLDIIISEQVDSNYSKN